MIYGIILFIFLQFFSFIYWLFGWSSSSSLSNWKPMARWTVDEVMNWLSQQGSWASESLSIPFANLTIGQPRPLLFVRSLLNADVSVLFVDGSLLAVLTEKDVSGMTSLDDLHVRAFIAARDTAMMLDHPPTSFWEFKVSCH